MKDLKKLEMDIIKDINTYLDSVLNEKGITLHEKEIQKNNYVTDALVFKQEGNNVSPTIYLKDYLDSGVSAKEIAKSIIDTVIEAFERAPDISEEILSPDYLKENLFAVVINYDKNKDYLKDVPHEKMNDLAIIPRVRVDENSSFVFTKPLEKAIKLTGEEVLEIAKRNTIRNNNFEIKNMKEVIEELTGAAITEDMEDMMDLSMNIISTKDNLYGASSLLDKNFLQSVSDKLGEDYFILPSSIHELVIIPKSSAADVEALKEMVQSVNSDESMVKPEDFLSNNVYTYSATQQKVMIATQENNISLSHDNNVVEKKKGRV